MTLTNVVTPTRNHLTTQGLSPKASVSEEIEEMDEKGKAMFGFSEAMTWSLKLTRMRRNLRSMTITSSYLKDVVR